MNHKQQERERRNRGKSTTSTAMAQAGTNVKKYVHSDRCHREPGARSSRTLL